MATDDFFKVNFPGLADAADSMRGHYQNLDNTIAELSAGLNTHLATWDSESKQLWAQIQQKWQHKMANAGQVIGLMSDHLNFANETWQGTENRNAGIWGMG
jgi:WXG100 family type VII secretion target